MNRATLSAVIAAGVLPWLACGVGVQDASSDELAEQEQALLSDPWQGIYALRSTGPGAFIYNPIGTMSVPCFDGVWRQECPVARLNFGATGLSVQRQQEVLTRLAAEPADEGSVSILVKARPIHVRDHTTGDQYDELRLSVVYRAPTVRAHGGLFLYVASPPDNGFQASHALNSDLASRTIDLAYRSRFRWVGPATQTPSSYPVDDLFTVASYRLLDPDSQFPITYEFSVDQRFRRVVN